MKIKLLGEDPYSEVICQYFTSVFHTSIKPNSSQLLEILTTILIGDKNMRLGPVPAVESLVVIRATISKAIELNVPIPILIAWGGRKTDATANIDVAEVSALHQLMRLQDVVRKFYIPGLHMHIRIEDTGADWIYRTESETIFEDVEKYSSSFARLVKMVANGYNIEPIRESWLMKRDDYFRVSEGYSEIIEDVIKWKIINRNDENTGVQMGDIKMPKSSLNISMTELTGLGWKGNLPMEQIDHYISRYKVLYPNMPMDAYILMASDYLGGAKARYDLDGRGAPDSSVGSFISISFIAPIPGAPKAMFANNLYYRTVPEKDGRTHIAPWRAKGYLSIEVDNSVKVKVTSWSNKELIDSLQKVEAEFTDNMDIVILNADYVAKDFEMPLMI